MQIEAPVIERRRWGWPELTEKLTPAPVVYEVRFRLWIYRVYDIGSGYEVYRDGIDFHTQQPTGDLRWVSTHRFKFMAVRRCRKGLTPK